MVRVIRQGLWGSLSRSRARIGFRDGAWGLGGGGPLVGQGQVGEGYLVSFYLSDSPMGPKHREAGRQDPRRSQQVDHRPELGAPPYVSDTSRAGMSEE